MRSSVDVLIPDVNVLIGAFRRDAEGHAELRAWLEGAVRRDVLGLTPAVSAGVIRILTNRKVFQAPDSPSEALGHIEALRSNASVVDVLPGPRHWEIFAELCRRADARGNLVADAAIATVAIEHRATLVTLDRGFARFPGLRWELPEA